MKQWANKQTGFTIVELLIVVVVIAILAAITIVAYNGITQRAKDSSVASTAAQAMKKIELFKSSSSTESYPATSAEAGIDTMPGVTYYGDPTRGFYCVEAVEDDVVYSATHAVKNATAGSCAENGIIGWWQLNGNGNDASVSNLTATISGTSAQGQNGASGGAYEFSGVPPSISVPNSQDILTPENTFSFWYYANSWNSGAATSFVAKRSGASTGHFIMRLTASNSLSIDCGGSGNRWTPNYSLPLTAWTHVVVTCTPTQVAAYVNGAYVGAASRTVSSLGNATLLQFAQDGGGYGLNGRMDDIRLFNRILTTGEVQKVYNEGAV